MCQVSHVKCQMSCDTCHVPHVTCHMSHVIFSSSYSDKVVKLVSDGSVINWAYPAKLKEQPIFFNEGDKVLEWLGLTVNSILFVNHTYQL